MIKIVRNFQRTEKHIKVRTRAEARQSKHVVRIQTEREVSQHSFIEGWLRVEKEFSDPPIRIRHVSNSGCASIWGFHRGGRFVKLFEDERRQMVWPVLICYGKNICPQ